MINLADQLQINWVQFNINSKSRGQQLSLEANADFSSARALSLSDLSGEQHRPLLGHQLIQNVCPSGSEPRDTVGVIQCTGVGSSHQWPCILSYLSSIHPDPVVTECCSSTPRAYCPLGVEL